MGILDHAKKLGDKVSELVTTSIFDKVISNTIIYVAGAKYGK